MSNARRPALGQPLCGGLTNIVIGKVLGYTHDGRFNKIFTQTCTEKWNIASNHSYQIVRSHKTCP